MSDLAPTRAVSVTRVGPDGARETKDLAATEEPLDIRLHGKSFAVIMRTPGQDRELAAGFLMSERVVRSGDEIGAVEHCRHPDQSRAHHVVDVYLRGDAASRVPALLEQRRQLIANSSCGVCGRATIEELAAEVAPIGECPVVQIEVLRGLPEKLRETQATFGETGGLHGAALFTTAGDLIVSAEDVGRHNAVDKVFGSILINDILNRPAVLVVSGRVAFEIVQKAWIGRVPIVAAVSAPTSLAIELAQEAGIALLGFVRGASLNIYTHMARIGGV
ncbi:MAG TPA: formate dehydrogenase accessory sulfurtransferase FdhD [Vicinamibacterales bacterium]|nr:formate dehydrogenase accessory sulfurtransferase FdhD [Vicinamibacterales bacterium]